MEFEIKRVDCIIITQGHKKKSNTTKLQKEIKARYRGSYMGGHLI